MIENTFIKKITAGILRNRKMTIVERNIMHPERDWLLGIFVGGVVVVIAAIWSVNTYVQFKNISVTSSAESPDAIIYKEHLVENALVDFSKRKETYELLKQELLSKKQAITDTVMPIEVLGEGSSTEAVVLDNAVDISVTEPLVEEQVVGGVVKME